MPGMVMEPGARGLGGVPHDWVRPLGAGHEDGPAPLTDASLEQIMARCNPVTVYDAAHGGTTGAQDNVAVLHSGDAKLIARPNASGSWDVSKFRVAHMRGQELPSRYDELRTPDFIGAGDRTAKFSKYRANDPIGIASGSTFYWQRVTQVHNREDQILPRGPMYEDFVSTTISICVDLAHFLGADRAGYRIFMEGNMPRLGLDDVDRAALAHFIAWKDDGLDVSRRSYTLTMYTYDAPYMVPRVPDW